MDWNAVRIKLESLSELARNTQYGFVDEVMKMAGLAGFYQWHQPEAPPNPAR